MGDLADYLSEQGFDEDMRAMGTYSSPASKSQKGSPAAAASWSLVATLPPQMPPPSPKPAPSPQPSLPGKQAQLDHPDIKNKLAKAHADLETRGKKMARDV